MITIIRQEGNEFIMSIPSEILSKLNIDTGATITLQVNEGSLIASPYSSSYTPSSEERELASIAILSSN